MLKQKYKIIFNRHIALCCKEIPIISDFKYDPNYSKHKIRCDNCGTHITSDNTLNDAIDTWNEHLLNKTRKSIRHFIFTVILAVIIILICVFL